MVYIHLISPNQGGLTEALTVFIGILFLAVQKAGGDQEERRFQHKQFCSLQE